MTDTSAKAKRGDFRNLGEFPLPKFSVFDLILLVVSLVRVQYLT